MFSIARGDRPDTSNIRLRVDDTEPKRVTQLAQQSALVWEVFFPILGQGR